MRVTIVVLAGVTLATTAHSAQIKWQPLNSPSPEVSKPASQPTAAPPAPAPAPAPVPAPSPTEAPSPTFPPLASSVVDAIRGYSAAPDKDTGIAMVEEAVKSTLKDPYSAHFTWPNGFVQGWYRPFLGKRYEGWITCGTVNAKNSYGGYVGATAVIAVVRDGVVIETNMDDPTARYGRDEIARTCAKIGVPVG